MPQIRTTYFTHLDRERQGVASTSRRYEPDVQPCFTAHREARRSIIVASRLKRVTTGIRRPSEHGRMSWVSPVDCPGASGRTPVGTEADQGQPAGLTDGEGAACARQGPKSPLPIVSGVSAKRDGRAVAPRVRAPSNDSSPPLSRSKRDRRPRAGRRRPCGRARPRASPGRRCAWCRRAPSARGRARPRPAGTQS